MMNAGDKWDRSLQNSRANEATNLATKNRYAVVHGDGKAIGDNNVCKN
jgi:hypothetical protein